MAKAKHNPKVDFYFLTNDKWQEEINKLRSIVLETGLDETLKWGVPCYTHEKSNIVLIHVFKEYCALLFFKGALLKDSEKILIQQSKNVQSGRQIRFINMKEIIKVKTNIKSFIREAIKVEEQGIKIPFKKTSEYNIPEELNIQFKTEPSLKKAFYELTPGRQRGYLLYFSQAKQSKTRQDRIEKYINAIKNGKGLND